MNLLSDPFDCILEGNVAERNAENHKGPRWRFGNMLTFSHCVNNFIHFSDVFRGFPLIGSAQAVVFETPILDVRRLVQVAAVEEDRPIEAAGDPLEVGVAKLLPVR